MSAPNVPPQVPAPAPNVPPQVPAPAPMPPAAAAPSTELPRHHVHHSYIWLESVRTIFIMAVCVVVANFSTIIGLVAEEGMGAEAGFIMAVAGIGTLVVILLTFGIVAGLRVVQRHPAPGAQICRARPHRVYAHPQRQKLPGR